MSASDFMLYGFFIILTFHLMQGLSGLGCLYLQTATGTYSAA